MQLPQHFKGMSLPRGTLMSLCISPGPLWSEVPLVAVSPFPLVPYGAALLWCWRGGRGRCLRGAGTQPLAHSSFHLWGEGEGGTGQRESGVGGWVLHQQWLPNQSTFPRQTGSHGINPRKFEPCPSCLDFTSRAAPYVRTQK